MNEKRLLITAFEPFGGESINAALEAVTALPDSIGCWQLVKSTIPVVFGKAAQEVIRTAEEISADAVLCIGQAAGRSSVTPELVAINLKHASIPDNDGNMPQDERIIEDGKEAYFSDMPVRRMAQAIKEANLSGAVSYSAGAYVCNDVFYRILRHFENTGIKAGFIHIPVTPQQGSPSMETQAAAAALCAAIKELD